MTLGTNRGRVICLAAAAALALTAHGQQTPTLDAPAEAALRSAPLGEVGIATVYAAALEGQLTASGEPYGAERYTAAHRTYPLGTTLRIIGVQSGSTVIVRVNDRWSGGAGRVINLSNRAARELGFGASGTMDVRIEVDELGTEVRRRREALPVRVSSDVPMESSAGTSRTRECARQARILGLRDDWADRHVRSCLAIRPKK